MQRSRLFRERFFHYQKRGREDAIGEASLGPDHPTVATRLNNLAGLLKATNRSTEAEPRYRRALAIDEASYGEDHPHTQIVTANYQDLLNQLNQT